MADRTAVKHAWLAFVLAFVGGVVLYPAYITVLSRLRAGQRVQSYGPASHAIKAGTPTMGGLLFCALAAVMWAILDPSRSGFVLVFALLGGAAVGLLDDIANIRGIGALGLLGRQKLLLQAIVGLLVGMGLANTGSGLQYIPGIGIRDIHGWVALIAAVGVVGASNAVNLTDGVDGLAASCASVALVVTWIVGLRSYQFSVATMSAALVGALLAFLVYNWFPARVFMGDTGSLAIGCVLVVAADEVRLLWLLPLLGVVFVAETLSVIINVTAIRRFGRRVFRSSPLHHHFEALGLREQRLVFCFGMVAALGACLTLLLARPIGVSL